MLEDIIGSLKYSSFTAAIERVQRLRESATPLRTKELAGSIDSPQEDSSTSFSDVETPQKYHDQALFDVGSGAVLPPENITRHAISSFFTYGSTLFYIIPQEACEGLIKETYDQTSDATNKSAVCLTCALAAIGAQYSISGVPDVAKEKYVQHAHFLLTDTLDNEYDTLLNVRVFICLSMYFIFSKSMSARSMTGKKFLILQFVVFFQAIFFY